MQRNYNLVAVLLSVYILGQSPGEAISEVIYSGGENLNFY